MRKIVLGVMVASLVLALGVSTGFAAKKPKYKEGTAGAGSISGTVSLKGTAMAPIMEDLSKGKNVEFCITHPDAKGNIRPRVKVAAAGGKLKDAVVFIESIETGKKWSTDPINFDFKTCDIFPKVSIVRKTPKGMKEGLVKLQIKMRKFFITLMDIPLKAQHAKPCLTSLCLVRVILRT